MVLILHTSTPASQSPAHFTSSCAQFLKCQ